MLKQTIQEKIESTDFNNAKEDVMNLLKDPSSLNLWSKDFFFAVCEKIKTI